MQKSGWKAWKQGKSDWNQERGQRWNYSPCLTPYDTGDIIKLNPALAVTLLRLLLVPVFAWLLLAGAYGTALWIFLIASISDALDGYLARRFNFATPLGAVLDPLADKLLVGFGILTLAWLQALPFWLALLVVLRDTVIVLGAAAYLYVTGKLEMAPLPVSKLNTGVQFVLVLGVVATYAGINLPSAGLNALVWLTLTTTLASGGQYVWVWARKARQENVG